MLFRVLSSSPRSVFSRLAYQSLWPNILGTDAAGVKKVDKRIKTLSLLATLGAIALAFSAAVTPLGLHTTLQLKEPEDTIFTYFPDRSVIGKGTQSRTGYSFNRVCGVYAACPGNNNPWIVKEFSNATWWPVNYRNPTNATISTSIATNITVPSTVPRSIAAQSLECLISSTAILQTITRMMTPRDRTAGPWQAPDPERVPILSRFYR